MSAKSHLPCKVTIHRVWELGAWTPLRGGHLPAYHTQLEILWDLEKSFTQIPPNRHLPWNGERKVPCDTV